MVARAEQARLIELDTSHRSEGLKWLNLHTYLPYGTGTLRLGLDVRGVRSSGRRRACMRQLASASAFQRQKASDHDKSIVS
jgi:hypothetical protein